MKSSQRTVVDGVEATGSRGAASRGHIRHPGAEPVVLGFRVGDRPGAGIEGLRQKGGGTPGSGFTGGVSRHAGRKNSETILSVRFAKALDRKSTRLNSSHRL